MNYGSVVVGATAEVLVDGQRCGSAVLIDGMHLLTAAHVVTGVDSPKTANITVFFPVVSMEFGALYVELARTSELDLAVLKIVDKHLGKVPKPINIYPDERFPDRVAAFGFPQEEAELEGVWRQYTAVGQTATAIRQLQWMDGGAFPGHSGGPVVDVATGSLVGILISGSPDGQFDRCIGIPEIAEAWPGLQRTWKYAGERALSHFQSRANGQRSAARGGDLFKGRDAAMKAISHWLQKSSNGIPLVIIGMPGSGKSAVLGRAAINAQRLSSRGLVYHAHDASAQDFLNAVANFLGLPNPEETRHLIEDIKSYQISAPFTVMLDALDEASAQADIRVIAETAVELSRLPIVNVVVSTRPLAAGNRFATGSLLSRLQVQSPQDANLIDLDAHPFRDSAAIKGFAAALLAQHGVDNPGPAGRAWETYRSHDNIRMALSSVIAERADPNFLVAAITAASLSERPQIVDPTKATFDSKSIPSNLDAALDEFYDSVDSDRGTGRRVRTMMKALAYARGLGISEDRWIQFTKHLGYQIDVEDIDYVRDSSGADYLIQTDTVGGERTIRLFHKALVDELLEGQPASHELKVYEALYDEVSTTDGWDGADEYIKLHLSSHAAASNRLPALLEDYKYIGQANIPNLVSAIGAIDNQELPDVGKLILQEGLRLQNFNWYERLWLLAFSATQAGYKVVLQKARQASSPIIFPQWAHARWSSYRKLVGHTGPVTSLAIGKFGWEDVVVSGSQDSSIRVWDSQGNLFLKPLTGHRGAVTTLALGTLEGDGVLVSGGEDKTVRLWDRNGELIAGPFHGHTRSVSTVRVVDFEGHDTILSAAPRGEFILWNSDGLILRKFLIDSPLIDFSDCSYHNPIISIGYKSLNLYNLEYGHDESIKVDKCSKSTMAIGRLGNADVVVCGLQDASLAVWRLDGTPARQPFLGHERPSRSIAIGRVGETDVVVSASQDNSLVVWDHRGNILAEPWRGHAGTAYSVAIGPLKTRDVVACGGSDNIVRVWDERVILDRTMASNQKMIRDFDAGLIGDDLWIFSASESGVDFYDDQGQLINGNSLLHTLDTTKLAFGKSEHGDIIVTATKDRSLLLWNVKGQLITELIKFHTKKIDDIAINPGGKRALIASSMRDNTIRIWDSGGDMVSLLPAFGKRGSVAIQFARLKGRDCLFVAGSDQIVRVWDVALNKWIYFSPKVSNSSITCVSVFEAQGDRIVALGCSDGRIVTWRPGECNQLAYFNGHTGRVSSMSVINMAGGPALVTVGHDGTLKLWIGMSRSHNFPLTESAAHVVAVKTQILMALGPGVAGVEWDVSTLEGESANWHESEMPAGENCAEDSTVNDRPVSAVGVLELEESTDREVLEYARDLQARGAYDDVIDALLPRFAEMPAALCLASDASFASDRIDLMERVFFYLRNPEMRAEPSIQGRLFALSITLGNTADAMGASQACDLNTNTAVIGLIKLLNGNFEREWQFYRNVATVGRDEISSSVGLFGLVPVVAAMRLLSVCRRRGESDCKPYVDHRDDLLEEYWSLFGKTCEPLLKRYLCNYVGQGSSEPIAMLPYQVLSIYEVVFSVPQKHDELTDALIVTLAESLSTAPWNVRSDFAAWALRSDIAHAVIMELAQLYAHR